MKCTECGMELKDGFTICAGCDDPVDVFQRVDDGSVYIFLPGRQAGIEYGINYEDVARIVRSGNEILRIARAKHAERDDEPHLEPRNATEVGE